MIAIRTFRNDDVPALAGLWDRGTPAVGVAGPLDRAEFKAAVLDRLYFEADGLLVAVEGDRVVGYCHTGFGPEDPSGRTTRLDRGLGAVAMLVVEPEADPTVADLLVEQGCRRLRDRGARVIYAGGQYPVNPFYWGIYGGSEFAGILGGHESFHRAALGRGFRAVARTTLMELDLARQAAPPLDPRTVRLRRQVKARVVEDEVLPRWWDTVHLGTRNPTLIELEHVDGEPLARATCWDMLGYERRDGRLRAGLIDVEVAPAHRRRGLGRYLIGEVIRHQSSRGVAALCVQTREANTPALALYRSLGFEPAGDATLYRQDRTDTP